MSYNEYGRDERSLLKLPFTQLNRSGRRKNKNEIRSKWEGKDANGNPKKFFKVVTASGSYGLPTYPAEDLYIALLFFTAQADFQNRTVRVVPYDLLKLMEWGTGGRAYERLRNALNQLTSVFIHTNALWDEESKAFVEAGFHFLDEYTFKKPPQGSPSADEAQYLEIKWGDRIFEHFERGRMKMLDVGTFYSLSSPLAKRLYRWVDEQLGKNRMEIDLRRLAHIYLEISRSSKYPSQIMQKLEPALKELDDRGICEWSLEKSQTESGKKLVITRPKKRKRVEYVNASVSRAGQADEMSKREERWLSEQLSRMTDKEREELQARAVQMLDPFNRSIYNEKGEAAIGSHRLVLENMRKILRRAHD